MEEITIEKPGKVAEGQREITKTSQLGTKKNETRATFILEEALLDKIKAMAYWHRVQIKSIAHHAFSDAIEKYEKWNGPIQPIPAKNK